MNRIRLSAVLSFLIISCADRIGPNDSIFDPDYEGGDYAFETRMVPDDDTLSIFQSYKLMCINKGKDRLHLYQFSFDTTPPGITTSSVSDVSFSDSSDFYFTAPYKGVLTVTAIQPNGNELYRYDTISVVNPYRIQIIDSGLLAKGTAILARVQNTHQEKLFDEKLAVQWYRGKTAVDTLDFMLPCTLYTGALPDTVEIQARLSDKSGNFVILDIVKNFVGSGGKPNVKIDLRQAGVPVDTTYTIEATVEYADSLIWISTAIDSVTTTTASLTHRWTDTGLVDTVIVVAKNRFGVEGNRDTILITPRSYRYGLDAIEFPVVIPGRKMMRWIVAATDIGRRVQRDSVEYVWTITPASKADTIIKNRDTLQLFCNPVSDTDSFGISVFAYHGTDSSWTKYATVKLFAFRPVIKLNPFDSSLALNDSVTFTVKTFDTDSDSSGKIDSVYYRTSMDGGSPHLMKAPTVTLKCGRANNQTVKFWCVDNRGFRSDTVLAEIVITSTEPHFVNYPSPLVAYINDSITISAPANPGNKESAIVEWTWDFDSNGTSDDTTSVNSVTMLYTTAGIRTITVGCRNREGDTAVDHAVITIDVQDGVPSVTSVVCTTQTLFINDTAAVRIKAFDGNGELHACSLRINGSAFAAITINPPRKTLDTLIAVPMPDTGKFRFSASVTDDDTLTSPFFKQTDSIDVMAGRPIVRKVTPDTCWIFDDTVFSIDAADVNANGTIDSIRMQWEAGDDWQTRDTLRPRHTYDAAGRKLVRIVAFDNLGQSSDTLTDSVLVNLGKPTVSGIMFPTEVWINDLDTCTVHAIDPNGSVKSRWVRWDDDSAFVKCSDSTRTHRYTVAGTHAISAFVLDDDGISSDTARRPVTVKVGAPTFDTIAVVNPGFSNLYINDPVRFTVKTDDENDDALTLSVSWNGSTSVGEPRQTVGDSAVFTHAFGRADSGANTIRFRVVDPDENSVDTTIAVQVLTGAPTVTLLSLMPEPASRFVRDTVTVRLRATDNNGSVRKICVNWNGANVAQDSVVCNIPTLDTAFTHAYDTIGGNYTVRLWAVDEDTIRSAYRDSSIFIRKCAPRLWGDTADTLWVVVDNGPGSYYIHVNSYDTNGVNFKPIRYYWQDPDVNPVIDTNISDVAVLKKTNVDSSQWSFGLSKIDEGTRYLIYGIDDDGLLNEDGSFWVFADSAPVAPNPLNPVANGDSVTLRWQNYDFKDGISGTHFTIYIDYALSLTPTTVLQQGAGSLFNWSGSRYNFTFKPTSPSFTWKIITSDQRGTKSSSVTQTYAP